MSIDRPLLHSESDRDPNPAFKLTNFGEGPIQSGIDTLEQQVRAVISRSTYDG